LFSEIHRIFQFHLLLRTVSTDLFISFHMFENFLWKAKARWKIYWEFYFNSYLQNWVEMKNRRKKENSNRFLIHLINIINLKLSKRLVCYTIAEKLGAQERFLRNICNAEIGNFTSMLLWSWGLFAKHEVDMFESAI
jgi:hypothetical protein